MDDLELFGQARPSVEPLDDVAIERIHREVFGDAATATGTARPAATVALDHGAGRRRWSTAHRLRSLAAAAVVVAATAAGVVLAARSGSPTRTATSTPAATHASSPASASPSASAPALSEAATPSTAAADLAAENFLITGADNHACVDPDSPYAGAFGDRSSMGERSDTVMVMRLDPATKRAAILSFPRDLWVTIAGKGGKGRINSAYVKDDPQRLIDTIYQNFGVAVDHYIQIDFCAFTTIVDAIDGGVGVPFEYPTRDTHTGLNVPEPGCYFFDGDAALAYVRSRYYQYYDDGTWKSDALSDLGRISRQQDFIRRVLDAARAQGLFDPGLAAAVLDAVKQNVVVDTGLTIAKMLEVVGVLADLEPEALVGYQIETVGRTIAGQSVLEPRTDGDTMQAILGVFRGDAPLTAPAAITPAPASVTPGTAATTEVAPDASAAQEQILAGVVPPRGTTC